MPESSIAGISQTVTVTPALPTLRLRPEPSSFLNPASSSAQPKVAATATTKKVEWTSEVIDNEHLNRKSSKICCIYHKPRPVDESSSSSSSDDDGSAGEGDARKAQVRKAKRDKLQALKRGNKYEGGGGGCCSAGQAAESCDAGQQDAESQDAGLQSAL